MKHQLARLFAAAVTVLAVVTTAAASNSARFADTAGDGASAPDVTSVAVSNNDAGTIVFKIGIGNRAALDPQDWVVVALDTDLAQDDEGYVHPEYTVSYGRDGASLELLAAGLAVDLTGPHLTAFGGSFASGVLTLSVNQLDIADATELNFWIVGGTDADESRDDVPDGADVWEYRIVSPSLYVLAFAPPKSAVAGKRLVAGMKVRGANSENARVVCSATVAGRRVAGVGSWFQIAVDNAPPQPRCTWVVPKRTKGKLVRATMSVVRSGLQVNRSFSLRVR